MVDRQSVIDRAINVENLLSILVTMKFFPGKAVNGTFLQQVMYDPNANTAFKVSVFCKCYPDSPKPTVEKIRRIFNIRNLYAHCGLNLTSVVDPDKSGIVDPNKLNEPLDFAELEREFLRIDEAVIEELTSLIEAEGVEIRPDEPAT